MAIPPSSFAAGLDAVVAATGFSGVVRVDRGGSTVLDAAFGLADRRHAVPMTTSTRLGIASGTKFLTALTVMSLVAEGALTLDRPVREVLGADLPLVDDRVTVEHLLTHRSGIGDYFDEEVVTDLTDHVLTVPVHTLETTEDYLAGARRPPAGVPARRAGGLQQLGLRRARAGRRTGQRATVRGPARGAGVPAGGHDRDGLPAR